MYNHHWDDPYLLPVWCIDYFAGKLIDNAKEFDPVGDPFLYPGGLFV